MNRMTGWVPERNRRQAAAAQRPVVDAGQRGSSPASFRSLRGNSRQVLLLLVAIILACLLVADLIVLGSGSQSISSLSARIGRLENSNIRIRNEIDRNMNLAVINAAAVRQDLISSRGATTISLTAPDHIR